MQRIPLVYIYSISICRTGKRFRRSLAEPLDAFDSRKEEAIALRDRAVEELFGNTKSVIYNEKHPYGKFITKYIKAQCKPLNRYFGLDQLEEAKAWIEKAYAEVAMNSSVKPRVGMEYRAQFSKRTDADGRKLPAGIFYRPGQSKALGDPYDRSPMYTAARSIGGKVVTKAFSASTNGGVERALALALEWRRDSRVLSDMAILKAAQDGIGSKHPVAKPSNRPAPAPVKGPKRLGHKGHVVPNGLIYQPASRKENGASRNRVSRYVATYANKPIYKTKSFFIKNDDGDRALAEALAWYKEMERKHGVVRGVKSNEDI